MGQIGARELVVLAIIVLLIFGAKRLPDIARSLGKSARILKSEAKAMKSDGGDASSAAASSPQGTAQEPEQPKTIQAAPGDVASARPVQEPTVQEPKSTSQA